MTSKLKASVPRWARRVYARRKLASRYAMPLNFAAMAALVPYLVADQYAETHPAAGAQLIDHAVNFVWLAIFCVAMWLNLSLQFYRMLDMADELEQAIAAREAYRAAVKDAINELYPEPAAPAANLPEPKLH